MFQSVKTKHKLAVMGVCAILLCTGCTPKENDNAVNEMTGSATATTQPADTNSSDPNVAVSSVVNKLSDLSQDSKSGLSIAGRNAQSILGAENSGALQQTKEARDKLRSLGGETLTRLAQTYSDYDVLSLYYDTSGLSDADRVILSMYMMGVSATFSATSDPITTVTVPNESVSVSGDTATVNLKMVTYDTAKDKARPVPVASMGTITTLHFVSKGGKWLIDGQAMINELNALP